MANTGITNIGVGTVANDNTGDYIRVGGQTINTNNLVISRTTKTIISAQITLALFISAEQDTTEYYTTEIGTIVQITDAVGNVRYFRQYQNDGTAATDYIEISFSHWIQLNISNIAYTSTVTFTVTSEDWSNKLGHGLMINQVYPTHIITSVAYGSGNSVVTVKGNGSVPNPITSMQINNGTKKRTFDIPYWYTTFNSGDTTDVLDLAINKGSKITYKGSKGRIVLLENDIDDVGTNTNGATWNGDIAGGSDLISSDVALANGVTSSTTLLQNNEIEYNEEIHITNPTASGVDDIEAGWIRVIIFEL